MFSFDFFFIVLLVHPLVQVNSTKVGKMTLDFLKTFLAASLYIKQKVCAEKRDRLIKVFQGLKTTFWSIFPKKMINIPIGSFHNRVFTLILES